MSPILPSISSVEGAADFSHVVPALWQGKDYFLQLIHGEISINQFYLNTNPLATAFIVSNVLSVYTLVLADVTGNYSQVDRLWSLLPAFYIGHFTYFAHATGIDTTRLDLIAIIAILWSARLTFNYARKGGYGWGSEDYRWLIIKSAIGKPAFVLFNWTFISFMQNWLLLSVTTPVYLFLIIAKNLSKEELVMGTSDMAFSRIMLAVLLLEFYSDQQQWNFQNAKAEYKKSGKVTKGYSKIDLERGFIVRGLWSLSRHPNFATEQSIWVLLYQWSCFATNNLYTWTGLGALSYLMLFQGSTWLTELLTSQKYPEYKTYQKNVGRFLPKLNAFTSGSASFEAGSVPDDELLKTQ